MVSVILRGGLGNNLYMVAATFCHALKHGFDYAIPLEVDNPHYVGQKPYIFPGIKYCDRLPDLPLYKEPAFTYTEIPPVDNIVLDGYFQSFKYSEGYRDELLKAFGFKWEPRKDWVSLHYRAGDYRKYPEHHPIVSDEYIEKAVLYFFNKGYSNFLVFSNEIHTIKDILSKELYKNLAINFEYSSNKSEIEDLQAGSCCSNQILSNGTFSLWQYYLNQNPDKECTSPAQWFGRLLPHDTKDLIPENAIII